MSRTRLLRSLATVALLAPGAAGIAAQDVLRGSEVPPGWNGAWPEALRTVPERTGFKRTTKVEDVHEFIDALKWRSENVHVFDVFRTGLGNISSAVVLAEPRVTSAQQARASGKPVVYLQGNIHPPEPEGAEALHMVMRDILLGDRRHLLENQIIVVVPVFNVDGTMARSTRDREPWIAGSRANNDGFDLNRDGVKLETTEVASLYREVLNEWDPVLFYDAHRMGRGNYAYGIAYATSTVPAAHPAPREYVTDVLFPAVRAAAQRDFRIDPFKHALFEDDAWPPKVLTHDATIWTVDAKFLASAYGLRNRMSILTETPGAQSFERQIYGQYAYILSLLEYTNEHGREMTRIVDGADRETVARVRAAAGSDTLRNWVDGEYRSRGEIEMLAYRDVASARLPGTSIPVTVPPPRPPERVRVEDRTLPVGTRDAWMPRGYLLPADLADLAAKLETHGVVVQALEAPVQAEGEEFMVQRMTKRARSGYDMTVLEGTFRDVPLRRFPAGTYWVDMAQPMANAVFYYLEPESRDGFVGWGVVDEAMRSLGVENAPVAYPVFKVRRMVE